MRRVLSVLVIASLALASAASAKELKSAQVCGEGEQCAQLEGRRSVESITDFRNPTSQPPTAAYYRLDFVYTSPGGRDRNAFSHLFVPSRNLIAAGGVVEGTIAWYPVTGPGLDLIRRSIANLQPFAASAAWPSSIDDPVFTPASKPKPVLGADEGTNWTP